MRRLAVESGTRGDSRAGGNEQNAGAGREFFGRRLSADTSEAVCMLSSSATVIRSTGTASLAASAAR